MFQHAGLSNLAVPIQQADYARGKYDLEYNEWDVLFTYDFHDDGCHRFTPYFGVAGINLNQKFTANLVDFEDSQPSLSPLIETSKWSSDFNGVGLRLGAEYEHTICDCFSLFANGHASILTGEADNKTTFTDTQDNDYFKFKDDDSCHQLVPGYHIAAGFNYEGCACGCEYNLRLGYEFLAWHNVPNHRVYPGDNLGSALTPGRGQNVALATSSNTRTLGFHGLFVGLGAGF